MIKNVGMNEVEKKIAAHPAWGVVHGKSIPRLNVESVTGDFQSYAKDGEDLLSANLVRSTS